MLLLQTHLVSEEPLKVGETQLKPPDRTTGNKKLCENALFVLIGLIDFDACIMNQQR